MRNPGKKAASILRYQAYFISLFLTRLFALLLGVSYFLTGEKVCKEPPGPPVWSRTPRRSKGERLYKYNKKHFLRFPL